MSWVKEVKLITNFSNNNLFLLGVTFDAVLEVLINSFQSKRHCLNTALVEKRMSLTLKRTAVGLIPAETDKDLRSRQPLAGAQQLKPHPRTIPRHLRDPGGNTTGCQFSSGEGYMGHLFMPALLVTPTSTLHLTLGKIIE